MRVLFKERMNVCMQMAGLTGSQLAKLVNIDPSLISRYRNGQRTPSSNSDISATLASTLYSFIVKNEGKKELSAYMRKPEGDINEDTFISWFVSADETDEESAAEAKSLLEVFDRYIKTAPVKPVPIDISEFSHLINDDRRYYLGEKGLQDGVIRFLGNVYLHTPREILLFSDQNMGWMVSDPAYSQVWASLMAGCIKSGVRIRIIHNINRGLSEMNQAIKSWLPLYMSGMVHSYYLREPEKSHFGHTLFYNPDQFAIQGWSVAGLEESSIFHFYTEPDHLASIAALFDGLLVGAAPLIYFSDECDPTDAVMSYDYSGMHINIFDEKVIIKNTIAPAQMFAFEHPLMVRAFQLFGKELK